MDTPPAFLVFADYYHAPDGPRAFQQVRPQRLAVFSTLEEAEGFVRAAASLDAPKHRGDKRRGYTIRWIPSDPPPHLYEQMLLRQEDATPWEALPRKDWYYDSHGVLTDSTDQVEATCDAHNALDAARSSTTPPPNPFRDLPPAFACGDLVRLEDWGLPDTYAVVTGVSTKQGFVRALSESPEWLGRYQVVAAIDNELMDEYVYNLDIEPYWGGERAKITRVSAVPEEDKILQFLSDYFYGKLTIPDEVVEDLVNGDIVTKNVAYFPFENFSTTASTTVVQAIQNPICRKEPTHVGLVASELEETERPYVVLVLRANSPDFESRITAIDLDWDASAVFSSEKSARAFLQVVLNNTEADYGQDDEIAQLFRIQLLELALSVAPGTHSQTLASTDLVTRCWCYDIAGRLLWQAPDSWKGQPDFERHAYERRYQEGDLVYVIPQGLDPDSESIAGDVAVVSAVPTPKETWVTAGKKPGDWNAFYTVDFVGDDYLQYYHVPESSLRPLTAPLPDTPMFLPIWSKYLRGELAFPEDLADQVRAGNVFLSKQPHFDFHAESVAAGMPKEYPAPRHRDFRVPPFRGSERAKAPQGPSRAD